MPNSQTLVTKLKNGLGMSILATVLSGLLIAAVIGTNEMTSQMAALQVARETNEKRQKEYAYRVEKKFDRLSSKIDLMDERLRNMEIKISSIAARRDQ